LGWSVCGGCNRRLARANYTLSAAADIALQAAHSLASRDGFWPAGVRRPWRRSSIGHVAQQFASRIWFTNQGCPFLKLLILCH
jgi:hypothetical protein